MDNYYQQLMLLTIAFTCVGLFVATAIACAGDLFNLIKLAPDIRKKLQLILLTEVIGISIAAFNGFMNPQHLAQQISQIQNSNTKLNADNQALRQNRVLVSIQISHESQRPKASELQRLLLSNNYLVPNIENVSGKVASPKITSVRYFNSSDANTAQQIAQVLQNLGLNPVNTNLISGLSVSPGNIEVWLANQP